MTKSQVIISMKPEDTPGSPEWASRFSNDIAEYASFFPVYRNVSGTLGSHRVKRHRNVPLQRHYEDDAA